jgi:hypothetical protein
MGCDLVYMHILLHPVHKLGNLLSVLGRASLRFLLDFSEVRVTFWNEGRVAVCSNYFAAYINMR